MERSELNLLREETAFLQVRQTELQKIRSQIDKEEQTLVERRVELFHRIGEIVISEYKQTQMQEQSD